MYVILGVLWERARVCTVSCVRDRVPVVNWPCYKTDFDKCCILQCLQIKPKKMFFTDFKDSQLGVTFSTSIQFRDQKCSPEFFLNFSPGWLYIAPIFHGISFSYLSLCLYFFLVQFLRINNKTQATQIHRTYNKKLLVTIVLQSHYHIILLPYVFLSCIWCMLIVGYMYMLWFNLILISIQILFS